MKILNIEFNIVKHVSNANRIKSKALFNTLKISAPNLNKYCLLFNNIGFFVTVYK